MWSHSHVSTPSLSIDFVTQPLLLQLPVAHSNHRQAEMRGPTVSFRFTTMLTVSDDIWLTDWLWAKGLSAHDWTWVS
jgi:hypothetical protein